jgi:hypothetical protein
MEGDVAVAAAVWMQDGLGWHARLLACSAVLLKEQLTSM